MKRIQLLIAWDPFDEGYDTVAEARAASKNLPPGKYLPVSVLRKSPIVVSEPPKPTANVVEWGEPFITRGRKADGD